MIALWLSVSASDDGISRERPPLQQQLLPLVLHLALALISGLVPLLSFPAHSSMVVKLGSPQPVFELPGPDIPDEVEDCPAPGPSLVRSRRERT